MRYRAKAPGKVILLGEHFVVHGNPALAAALDRGVEAVAEEGDEDIVASEDLRLSSPISKPAEGLAPLCASISKLLSDFGRRGVKVTLRSSIPVSAGLGSSASSAVAALSAVSGLFDLRLDDEALFDYAMISERMVHENPSGVDVYVAVHGGLVYFQRSKKRSVSLAQRFPIVVCCTGSSRRTGDMVARVAAFKEASPETYRTWATASSKLVEDCARALEEGKYELLAQAMNFHHMALKAMGVSTPELDSLVREARSIGFSGAKLTGGGGGGCMIALPTRGDEVKLFHTFNAKHPNSFLSYIPSEGVRCWSTK